MKVNIDIDCSPEEARRFMGLPDISPANEAYVDNLSKAVSKATSLEQLQQLGQQFAPLGQFGLQMFQDMMAKSAGKPGKKD